MTTRTKPKEGKKNEESCCAWAVKPELDQTCALQFAFITYKVTPMNNLRRRIGNRKSSRKYATQNKLVLLGNPTKRFDLEDVLWAGKLHEEDVLGKGTSGTTYKVYLEDQTTTMVVKRLNDVVLSAEDFQGKVEAVGAMDHENLLPLRGYFYSKYQKFLLYDYMPMGSLSDLLHRNGGYKFHWTALSWEVRLSIALGAARAIEHLHAQSIHHGNIKSSNVLLTPSYKAQVSDYGLPHLTRPDLMGEADPSKADVYDFGVLLLELLTGKPSARTHRNEVGGVEDLPAWVNHIAHTMGTAKIFDDELIGFDGVEEGMVELFVVANSCLLSYSCPQMSEVRRKIEELCSPGGQQDGESQPDMVSKGTEDTSSGLIPSAQVDRDSQLYEFGKVNNDTYTREPPDGVFKVSERVCVFYCCLTVDGLKDEDHQILIGGIVAKVRQHFPGASFMVLDFREQGSQSQISVLSDMTVVNYPIHHGDCPILPMEMIQHFLRLAYAWLSLEEQQNVLLMHCERGGWPVLAFMLAALLLYWKKSKGEMETLDWIYNKAPCDLLHLTSPLNPLPSQLRYLHYISRSIMVSEWCPPDKALTLDSVILRFIPCLDAEVGCCLIFKIFGQDPHNLTDKTPTVLFSTPERSKDIKYYKQADCKLVKMDIHCPVQGDVVLECLRLDASLEHGQTMFRVMFNTAYLLENVLMLGLDQMDVPWDCQDRYSREFRAEITFSEMNPAASLVSVDSSGDQEQTENQIAKRTKKIEAEELQVEDQAVYSALCSQDANTSNEENEGQEWPIQSNTPFSPSILLPMLPSQSEASARSALDGYLASSDSAHSSINPNSDPHFVLAPPPPPPPPSFVSRTPPSSLFPDVTPCLHPPPPPPHAPLLLDSTLLNEGEMLNLPNDDVTLSTSGSPVKQAMPSFELFQNSSSNQKNIEPPKLQSFVQQLVSSLELSLVSSLGLLSQDVHSGETHQFHEWKEGTAAAIATNLEITSGGDCASSSAVSSDSIAATKQLVHNSAQIPKMTMLREEKPCQLDGVTSSTSTSLGYDYDVFLSFRGTDTRSGITDFLYTSLLAAGIHTHRDDEQLPIGEEIGPELLKAINFSKISIPIFSKGYAFSKWCLSELVQMVECMKSQRQKIMPIFYDVTPSEVRHQTGSYGDAFVSHEKQFDNKIISKWKAALKEVGYLKGWDINSRTTRREGELVKLIVQKVTTELKRAYLPVTDCLVGIEHHVKEINRMVCGDSEDIQIVGIHGMGGVGKTTLAKIIYNRLSHHFEDCCFLSKVRETSQLKGIECLQNQLISDILKEKWSNISNVEEGNKMIKERLCGKKVLVLLDDVDQMTHWDALIGKPAWFGLGSRIIITSRNKDIVGVPEVCYPYELMSMNFNVSLQLFCTHAFGRDYPLDDYIAFSTEVVKSTGGLPLALEAIGKLLPRRSKDVWDVILKKLKQFPLNEVKRKLKISYDALDDWQKHIFLDIACLFTGFDQRMVLHLWKDSNLFPEEGLEVLQKMSLIKIGEDNKIWMHDQLRGLGRDIVRLECNVEQEKQTRLWNHEEGLDMVMEMKGTKKIEALYRKFDPRLLYYFANEEVERLSNLRCPEVRVLQDNWPSNDFPANIQNNMLMLSKLRWLSWHHFPLEVKITNFSMMNIVILHLGHRPNLTDIQSIEGLVSLRILKLIEIPQLERLLDLSNLKKLNELHLGQCHNLINVQSIEGLGNLRTLKLIEIPLLKRLPDLSNLKKLTKLYLRYCHGLTEIKSFEGLENLMILKLGELPLLERLPNLSNLKKLTQLDLRRCHNLVKIQGRLESLEDLCIQGCRSLDEVLDPASSFKKLKSLRIHDCKKLHLDRIWVSKFEIFDRAYGNSTCLILSEIGICVCQLGRQFFLPSLP